MNVRKAVFTGFDSAWTATNEGAIAHVTLLDGTLTLEPPVVAGFDAALGHIQNQGAGADLHVIGIDQPLIVPNLTGCRPVERAVGSLISRLKGGMQPANRGKLTMFGDPAPIWPFLGQLGANADWRASVRATVGRYAIEVYPAAAIAGLFPEFRERGWLPKYNPGNRAKFSLDDWQRLCALVGDLGDELGMAGIKSWCGDVLRITRPRKSDQDRLDAVICVIVTYLWWRFGRERSLVIGDPDSGYVVMPADRAVARELIQAASSRGVPVDAVEIRRNCQ